MTSTSWNTAPVVGQRGHRQHPEDVVAARLEPGPGLVAGPGRPEDPVEGDVVDAGRQRGPQRLLVGIAQVDPVLLVRPRSPRYEPDALTPRIARRLRAAHPRGRRRRPRSRRRAPARAARTRSPGAAARRVDHLALVRVPRPVVAVVVDDLVDVAVAQQLLVVGDVAEVRIAMLSGNSSESSAPPARTTWYRPSLPSPPRSTRYVAPGTERRASGGTRRGSRCRRRDAHERAATARRRSAGSRS